MRARIVVLSIYILGSCASPETHPPAAVSARGTPDTISEGAKVAADSATALQRSLPAGYTLTDTTEWSSMLEYGERAVLRRGGVTIDTVDLVFGVSAVGVDSLVFLQVRTDTIPLGTTPTPAFESFPTEHFLWTPTSQTRLETVVPLFNSYFSSPMIAGKSTILYWGLRRRDDINALYAMRYDFRTSQLDSLSLNREDPLATDYRFHLRQPQVHDSEVAFDTTLVDATTWRRTRHAPSPRE